MNFLVVGGNGFLGSHLVDALAGIVKETVVLDRREDPFRDRNPLVTYHIQSVPSVELCERLASEADVIVYLACGVRTQDQLCESLEEIERDIRFLCVFLKGIRKLSNKFIYISSGGAIYGESPGGMGSVETDVCRPRSAYGLLKLTQEGYVNTLLSSSCCRYVILRPTNLYGPRQNPLSPQGVVSVLLFKAIKGEMLTVYGDGTAVRDFLYVSDLVSAILLCSRAEISGETFNVGSGRAVTINELIDSIRSVSGLNFNCQYLPRRGLDLSSAYLDVSKIESILGWRAEMPFDQGIRLTLEYLYKNSGISGP